MSTNNNRLDYALESVRSAFVDEIHLMQTFYDKKINNVTLERDQHIERLCKENKRLEEENKRLETLLEKLQRESVFEKNDDRINHYLELNNNKSNDHINDYVQLNKSITKDRERSVSRDSFHSIDEDDNKKFSVDDLVYKRNSTPTPQKKNKKKKEEESFSDNDHKDYYHNNNDNDDEKVTLTPTKKQILNSNVFLTPSKSYVNYMERTYSSNDKHKKLLAEIDKSLSASQTLLSSTLNDKVTDEEEEEESSSISPIPMKIEERNAKVYDAIDKVNEITKSGREFFKNARKFLSNKDFNKLLQNMKLFNQGLLKREQLLYKAKTIFKEEGRTLYDQFLNLLDGNF